MRVHGPRHAAGPAPTVGLLPVVASIALVGLAVLALPALRDGGAEAARALGFTHPLLEPGDGPSSPSVRSSPADTRSAPDTATGRANPTYDGSDPVQVTTTATGAVVVTGLDAPFDATRVSALTPWFPSVDGAGAPTSSSPAGTPSSAAPVEIPPVPVEWTPSPEPSPDDAPTQLPSPTPSVETSTPAPELTPTPTPGPSTVTPEPTISTPVPTPTPSSPPTTATGSALRFSPPALTSPTVVAFPEGSARLTLDLNRDYVVALPVNRPLRNALGLTIVGGRNVVIIGGTVDVGDGDAGVRRGMYLKDATPNGTTYVEGVRFYSSTTGALTEGIDIASPGAKVVLQNIAIDGALTGSYATNHADVIQAWAGPEVLQVDGLTAATQYQGMFLLPNQNDASPVYDWSLHRIAITGGGVYLAWRDGGSYAIRTSDVYLSGSRIANGGLWPNAGAWPGVTVGRAPEAYGESAGFGYASPGYV